jgi:N utilization substance protein B
MKSRHRAREIALQMLYQYDSQAPGLTRPQGSKLSADLVYHFDHFNIPEGLREFISQLVAGTLQEMGTLDGLLEKHASNWKVARMSSVDRSVLRMAIYEMIHIKETPHTVVIDEAIELAKGFGTSESPSFINGILDSIRMSLSAPI